ncbi:hypothetical protein [Frondihabitans sucicola]|uniref:hypothetical protein n=1 Tax=Frondihabitans sucicola TaxID=1268041 RepID=UPI0025724A8A|nr:hypothetical protein [Frondihabitans sucicola]
MAGTPAVPAHVASEVTTSSAPSAISQPVAIPSLSAPVEGDPGSSPALTACGASRGRATALTGTGRVRAADCLAELADVGTGPLARFADSFDTDDASAVTFATSLGERGSAAETRAWWTSLSEERRTALTRLMPSVVGNLEGVPYQDRDIANRITLATTIAALEKQADEHGSGIVGVDVDARRLTMLQQVEIALDRGREETTRAAVSCRSTPCSRARPRSPSATSTPPTT